MQFRGTCKLVSAHARTHARTHARICTLALSPSLPLSHKTIHGRTCSRKRTCECLSKRAFSSAYGRFGAPHPSGRLMAPNAARPCPQNPILGAPSSRSTFGAPTQSPRPTDRPAPTALASPAPSCDASIASHASHAALLLPPACLARGLNPRPPSPSPSLGPWRHSIWRDTTLKSANGAFPGPRRGQLPTPVLRLLLLLPPPTAPAALASTSSRTVVGTRAFARRAAGGGAAGVGTGAGARGRVLGAKGLSAMAFASACLSLSAGSPPSS